MENELMINQKEKLLEELEVTNLPKKDKEKYYDVISKVDSSKFPIILNTFHLANLFGIKWSELKNMINNSDKYYHDFYISKKRGKEKRKISAPSSDLFYVQKQIKMQILDKIEISKCSFGFKQKCSIVDNAKYHLGAKKILSLDLKNFFPSIRFNRVYYIFYNICGYHSDVASSLTKLVMKDKGLPQGAPTSPVISNIVSYKLDYRLEKLAKKMNIKYSRYADDMVFSGSEDQINGKLGFIIRKIVEDEGFHLNKDKTNYFDSSKRMEVTGIVINNNKLSVKRQYIRKIEQELYFIKKFGLNQHLINSGINNSNYIGHLNGKISFVYMINKEKGEELYNKFNNIFQDTK